MPDLRSSRFARPFTRSGSIFLRLRDQPRKDPEHRHGRSEPEAPLHASSVLYAQTPPKTEPQWSFADGARCYPAVPSMPGLEPLSEAPWSVSNAHPSVRPDLGTAGPQDEPGEDDDDDDASPNDLLDNQLADDLDDDLENLEDLHNLDDLDDLDDDLDDEDLADDDFVVDEWWACEPKPDHSFNKVRFPGGDLALGDLALGDSATGDTATGEGAPWPIETPDDAIDTFELLRSSTFHSGLMVLALDHNRVPILRVALRGNVDDIERALRLFSPSLPNGRIPGGLILGVVRSHHREAPQSVLDSGEVLGEPSIWVDPVESATWRVAAWNLHDEGIKLHDVIVIEPDRWMSLARAAGLIAYDTLQYA